MFAVAVAASDGALEIVAHIEAGFAARGTQPRLDVGMRSRVYADTPEARRALIFGEHTVGNNFFLGVA